MKPTDDELEAMARRLDQSDANEYSYDNDKEEAAAMLRACMGRATVDTHTVASEAFKAIVWGSQQPPPPHGAAYPSYTRYGNSDAETEARATAARILAALEPAPDHAEWNAAIEAAAKEIDCGCDGACMWPHACPKEDIEAIRNLKKGPDHE